MSDLNNLDSVEILPLWSQAEAIDLAAQIERAAYKIGYHAALTGSCLYRGFSSKDCDIILYPHKSRETKPAADVLARLAEKCGVVVVEERKHTYDDKEVWWCKVGERRVDIFFME